MPAASDANEDALEAELAADVLAQAADDHAGRDGERDEPGREDEEHRDQNELCRDRGPGADLEVQPVRDGVDADQQQRGDDARRPFARDRVGHDDRRRQERPHRHDQRAPLADREPAQPERPPLLDEALRARVESCCPCRGGHEAEIGSRQRPLDPPERQDHSSQGSGAAEDPRTGHGGPPNPAQTSE